MAQQPLRREVWCTFRLEMFHRWPDAPPEVAFLRDSHRHLFWFKCWVDVTHNDRDVEFILLKRQLSDAVAKKTHDEETLNWSCEHWAQWLIETQGLTRCEVSEDGENGAILELV